MKQLWRLFERALLGLSFFLFLGGDGHAAEMKKFTLGYSTVGPAGTGLWMAKEIGAFEKYGINVDLIFISSGPVVVQALIGGDLQGGLAATNAVISALRVELYKDADKFLDRVPRVEPEAIAPIVEFIGKKPIPVETIADNSVIDRLAREGFIEKLYKKR